MAKSREIKMPLPSAADSFSTQAERDEEKRESVQEISFAEISDFPNHPFKVRMDQNMLVLVSAVKMTDWVVCEMMGL